MKKKNLLNKNIPAATNVAECIRAEAGAGASIESGNQKWKINWADFIKEDIIINIIKIFITLILQNNIV